LSAFALPASGTIVFVHNLRNRLFLAEHGLGDVPLMISATDILERPYLQHAIRSRGIKAHLGVRGPILVDSGGFSSMSVSHSRTGIDHVEALIGLYRTLDADVLAVLDIPPGISDRRHLRASKWRATLANLDRMMSELPDSRLMPVIHGRSLADIDLACSDVLQRIHRPRMIALGGMVPFLRGHMSQERFTYTRENGDAGSSAEFVADAMALCKAAFSTSRLHVFGVGSPTTAIALLALGADSVDSLAWRRTAGYGTIFLSGCAERAVSSRDRIHSTSRPSVSQRERLLLSTCRCPVCANHRTVRDRLATLSESYVARSVHNVWTLLAEERALRLARTDGTLDRFLSARIHGRHRFASLIKRRFS
jgi:queuine/archaeosine tRNA-ribosyltransferase